MKSPVNPRFETFRKALMRKLGTRASLLASGEVLIHANEFSGERYFRSVQAAIDTFFRYMPEELQS